MYEDKRLSLKYSGFSVLKIGGNKRVEINFWKENVPDRKRVNDCWVYALTTHQLSLNPFYGPTTPKLYQSHNLHHQSPNVEKYPVSSTTKQNLPKVGCNYIQCIMGIYPLVPHSYCNLTVAMLGHWNVGSYVLLRAFFQSWIASNENPHFQNTIK